MFFAFQRRSKRQPWFLKTIVAVLCMGTIVCLAILQFTQKLNMIQPGSICLNSEITSSKEDPKMYFVPLIEKSNQYKRRYLIYHCENFCGGLGDRFRGIVNSFILALITNRTYGIHHTMPCPLQNFLRPNKYNWVVNQTLKGGITSKVYDLIDHTTLPSPNMTSHLKEDIVYVRMNRDITVRLMDQVDVPKRIPWLTKFSVAKLFESVLSHLFVLSEDLQTDIDEFKKQHVQGNKTVCVHYRTGKNPTNPNDDEERYGNRYLKDVWKFLSKFNMSGHVIYIASDSEHVKREAKTRYPERFIDIHGKILHVDRSKDDANCTGFRKGILEHNFLQQCDVILLSRSGFGRTAAFLRTKSENMFCLRETGISMCSKDSLLQIINY